MHGLRDLTPRLKSVGLVVAQALKRIFPWSDGYDTIALADITNTGGLVRLTHKLIAKYPGDKDGLASFCVNLRVTLPQEMKLHLQALAVIGLRPEWTPTSEGISPEGPVYVVGREGALRTVLISHVAAGLQVIFDRKRTDVNHNLRMRFIAALYADWGVQFIDAAACAALVRLGWGVK